ncbi:MAG: phage/plasmid primase, P4 family, partial [Burkholderiaceae bacterium]
NEGQAEPLPKSASNTEAEKNEAITNDYPVAQAKELLDLHHSIPNGLNFEATRELAHEFIMEILEHWLPEGEQRSRQYVACNPTRDDNDMGSFSINVETGLWSDFATDDKGGDVISLIAYVTGCEYQSEAAVKILEFIAGMEVDDGTQIIKRNSERKSAAQPEYEVIMPIPDDQLRRRPTYFGKELGTPVSTWEYRNAAGQSLCYVNRFNIASGKTFLPQTFWKDSTGWGQWANKAPPVPRPAYGLNRLAARPDAIVLFNEGEKSADAAQRLFPEFVAVTTINGSKSPEKTDFTPFAGRKVYIAPDNDKAGTEYKHKLIELLRSAGAEVQAVLKLDMLIKNGTALAQGYDLADAEADGWTAEELSQLGEGLWEAIDTSSTLPVTCENAQNKRKDSKSQDSKDKRTALEIADDFASNFYDGKIAFCNNQSVAYSDGYWKVLNPETDIKLLLLEEIGEKATAKGINGIYDLVKIKYATRPEQFERNSPLICLNNGTLDPVKGILLPHSSDHYLTNKIAIEFNPEAQCPLWIETMNEIFLDSDRAEKIQLLQEFIGYCLIPDTRLPQFLWLVGAGGNGKSLILAIITALVGKANISYAQIERLQEKFVRAELQGKLANISSEMGSQSTISDGYLKQVTSGDIIEAERKFERPFSFKPYARLIGATNTLPRLLDHSDGFFRRAIIIRFNRQFTEAEQDKQREVKLMAELSGILNWALAGLQNVLQRGAYVIPSSASDEVKQYRLNSDPVRQFADECLEQTVDNSLFTKSADMYEHYREWSDKNGYQRLAISQFATRLLAVGIRKGRNNAGRYWAARFHHPVLRTLPEDKSTSAKILKFKT